MPMLPTKRHRLTITQRFMMRSSPPWILKRPTVKYFQNKFNNNNKQDMKSLLHIPTASAVVLIALLASCSSKTESKTTQLETLKKEQAEISKKIEILEKEVAKENPQAAKKEKMKDVNVVELAPRPFDHFVQTQGTIVSIDNIQMSARTAGIVTFVYTREGETVTQGQVMAQIDNSLIVRGIDELKSNLS